MKKIFIVSLVGTSFFCIGLEAKDCRIYRSSVSTEDGIYEVIQNECLSSNGFRDSSTLYYTNLKQGGYDVKIEGNKVVYVSKNDESVHTATLDNGKIKFISSGKSTLKPYISEEYHQVHNGHGGQQEKGSYHRSYDSEGKLTLNQMVWYEYSPKAENKWPTYHNSGDILYDNNGNILQKNIYDNNGHLVNTYKYLQNGTYEKYDEKGNKIGIYNADGTVFSHLPKYNIIGADAKLVSQASPNKLTLSVGKNKK